MFGHMGGYGYGGFFSPGNGFGGLSQLLFVLGIGLVIYLIFKKNNPSHRGNSNYISNNQVEGNQGIEIAKLRYVKGEITFDEYQKIVNTLRK